MRTRAALATLVLAASSCASSSTSDVVVRPLQVTTTTVDPTITVVEPTTVSSGTPTSAAPAVTTAAPLPPASAPTPSAIAWKACGKGIECGSVVVPLDYANPTDGQTIALNVKRRKATGASLGPLLVNPGGPGVGGTVMVDAATGYFDKPLLDRFDLVAWDPRGTGKSDGVTCVDDVDQLLAIDPTPDDAAERAADLAAVDAFAAGCKARSGRVLPFIATEDSARDIDQIRQALGVDKITYFGFSYGSRLGATYATLFPDRLRTMVIDGAEDPTVGEEQLSLQQIIGFENAFASLLKQCAEDTKCPFHHGGQPGPAFDALMDKLDKAPLLVSPDRPPVNQGVAAYAVAEMLYFESRWPALTAALAAAEQGRGSGLLALYDSYTHRNAPGEEHLFDAFIAINCLDTPGPTDPAAIDAYIARAVAAAPRLGRLFTSPGNVCANLSPRRKQVAITGAGAGKILVVGTTGDPATPYDGTVHMAEALEQGVLLTVNANQHTGYFANDCATNVVNNVLINLNFPAKGKTC